MTKGIGDTFKRDSGIWEIVKYDSYEDSYICHRLDTFNFQIKNFRREEIGGM